MVQPNQTKPQIKSTQNWAKTSICIKKCSVLLRTLKDFIIEVQTECLQILHNYCIKKMVLYEAAHNPLWINQVMVSAMRHYSCVCQMCFLGRKVLRFSPK